MLASTTLFAVTLVLAMATTLRTAVLYLAMRAGVACGAVSLDFAVLAGTALQAILSPLAMGTAGALSAVSFHLAMGT